MTEINRDIGMRPELKWVEIDLITIDRNYQRDINERRVVQILRDFSWEKFGAVMLSAQDDGKYTVYDGQHRVKAAYLHPDVTHVPATITLLQSTSEEAGAFLGVNVDRTAVTSVQKYWAGLEAGDKDYLQIRDVLAKAGCEIAAAPGDTGNNKTNAVHAVKTAIKRYGDDAVVSACLMLRQSWPKNPKALKAVLITALSRLYKANPHLLDDRLLGVLRRTEPLELNRNAEAMRKISGGDAVTSLARTLCEIYNRGIQKNQIQIGARS